MHHARPSAGSHGPVRRKPLAALAFDGVWGGSADWIRDPDGTEFTQWRSSAPGGAGAASALSSVKVTRRAARMLAMGCGPLRHPVAHGCWLRDKLPAAFTETPTLVGY